MPAGRDEPMFPIRNRDSSGGVNNKLFPTDISDNQAQELRNIRTDVLGIRQKRLGSTVAATGVTFGPIMAMAEYTPDTGNSRILAVAPGDGNTDHARLYEWDGNGGVMTFVGALTGYTGGTARDYNITVTHDFDATGLSSQILAVMSEDKDGIAKWYYDGNSLQQTDYGTASPASARFMHTYALDRCLMSGGERYRGTLVYSEAGRSAEVDAFPTPGTKFFRFGSDSQQKIRAVEMFRNNIIIVFMSDRIDMIDTSYKSYQLTTTGAPDLTPGTNWQIIGAHESIGCGSRVSVANGGEDVFFADQFGNIRSLARTIADSGKGVSSLPVSDAIQATIDRINPAAISRIVAETHDRLLVVGFPLDSNTEASEVWTMDMVRLAQTGVPVWDGPWDSTAVDSFRPYSMVVAELEAAALDADKRPSLYVGSPIFSLSVTAGILYRLFRGNSDNGSASVYQETTKRQSLNAFELEKTWLRLESFAVGTANATMHVEANLDARGWEDVGDFGILGESPTLPQDLPFTLGGTGVVAHKHALTNLSDTKSRDIAFRYTCSTVGEVKMLGHSIFGHSENYDRSPSDG